MKPLKNFILLANNKKENRYRIGATTKKEAIALLKQNIDFDSTELYYTTDNIIIPYGTVVKETIAFVGHNKIISKLEKPKKL